MPLGLHALPLELLRATIAYLDLDEFCNLLRACETLRVILGAESTSKDVVRRCIPQSKEAKLADQGCLNYRQAVINTYHRRKAYTTARPYSALVLGEGSDFLYRDGVLVYLQNGVLHVFSVHQASSHELVIDLYSALRITRTVHHRFELMHYQDGVLSIFRIGRSVNSEAHLLVFDTRLEEISPSDRLLLQCRLQMGQKQFIRHDSKYLVYGTYTGNEDSEDDIWRFRFFSLVKGSDAPNHTIGSFSTGDVGSSIVFEIYCGWFYVVTSQITTDPEGKDPVSYYGGCRYPLADRAGPSPEYWRMWRRQQREGPINDLWTDLSLQEDENRGGLVISESRREWQDGYSKQIRSFYSEALNLTAVSDFNNLYGEFLESKQPEADSTNANPDDDEDTVEILLADCPAYSYPDSSRPDRRCSRGCHPEYYGKSLPDSREFSLGSTKYRNYNHSNSAFLDIVVDDIPPTECPQLSKHLRIRIGSRALTSPLDNDGLLYRPDTTVDESLAYKEQFEDRGIYLWPPSDAPAEVFELLNGGYDITKLKASSDERTIIYMPGLSSSERNAPIVLINFDPAIRFSGLQRPRTGKFGTSDGSRWETQQTHSNPFQSGIPTGQGTSANIGMPLGASSSSNTGHDKLQSWVRIEPAAWLEKRHGIQFS